MLKYDIIFLCNTILKSFRFEIMDTKITVKATKRLVDTNFQEINVRPHVGPANVRKLAKLISSFLKKFNF